MATDSDLLQDQIDELTKSQEFLEDYLRTRGALRRKSQREALVAVTIGMVVSIAIFISGFSSLRKLRDSGLAAATSRYEAEISGLREEVASLKALYADAKTDLATAPPELVQINDSVAALEARLSRLELAVSNDPERALTVPLLRKDVDRILEKVNEQQAATDADIRAISGTVNAIFWALLSGMGVLILAGGRVLWMTYRDDKPRSKDQA